MSPIRRVKTKIGELLLQKGLITQGQLQEALSLQHGKEKGKPLGQILVEAGYIGKEQLCILLAVQSGYPYIDINQCIISPEILSLVPLGLIKKHQALPIDKIQDILNVAMVNPLDIVAIDQIQKLTNSTVKVFLTTPLELEEMIARYYSKKQE